MNINVFHTAFYHFVMPSSFNGINHFNHKSRISKLARFAQIL